jgi:hypothetical protein
MTANPNNPQNPTGNMPGEKKKDDMKESGGKQGRNPNEPERPMHQPENPRGGDKPMTDRPMTDKPMPGGRPNDPNRPSSERSGGENPDADERRRKSGETLPSNPTLPRYGDTDPNDPRKTDANARRSRDESEDETKEASE